MSNKKKFKIKKFNKKKFKNNLKNFSNHSRLIKEIPLDSLSLTLIHNKLINSNRQKSLSLLNKPTIKMMKFYQLFQVK